MSAATTYGIVTGEFPNGDGVGLRDHRYATVIRCKRPVHGGLYSSDLSGQAEPSIYNCLHRGRDKVLPEPKRLSRGWLLANGMQGRSPRDLRPSVEEKWHGLQQRRRAGRLRQWRDMSVRRLPDHGRRYLQWQPFRHDVRMYAER